MRWLNGFLIKRYNQMIAWKWLNVNNPFCRRLRGMMFHNICYKCEASFGKKNPERVFYVIRCPQEELGVFGLFNYVVYHLKLAARLNAEPVVDWKYYPNNYISEDYLVGKENVWERFFCQTTNITIDEVYQSRNVIMSHGNGEGTLGEICVPEDLQKSHELVKQYIRLNARTYYHIEKIYKDLGLSGKRVLGVKCRGTDFVTAKPSGHSVCPTAKETFDKIVELEQVWGKYDLVFLATEDYKILVEMKQYFDERLVYLEERRFEAIGEKWLSQVYDDKKYTGKKYEDMLSYISSVYILASCDALVLPVVGASLGAMRIKGCCEKYYIFQMGIYQ